MGTERYSFDHVPGPTTTISFRVPETAALILDEILRDPEVDVSKRTQAMQDAFVKWVMLEEHAAINGAPAVTEEKLTGMLPEPTFVRGFDPTKSVWRPPQRPSRWARHFELGRQNPARWNPATQEYDGGWMLVAEIKRGGCKARLAGIQKDRMSIEHYLTKYYPLERWQLRQLTVPNTWCDRELYMRFLGYWTPEEKELVDKQRRELHHARLATSRERRAQEAAAARRKAQEEEAAAKVRIRARRKPGQ